MLMLCFPHFVFLSDLSLTCRLELAYNQISLIGDGLKGLKGLTWLDLSHNQLHSAEDLQVLHTHTPQLLKVDLRGNKALCEAKSYRGAVFQAIYSYAHPRSCTRIHAARLGGLLWFIACFSHCAGLALTELVRWRQHQRGSSLGGKGVHYHSDWVRKCGKYWDG